jgi:hypothetical protein
MNIFFIVAAFLFVALGIAHSYLGERFILIPLFKRGHLPKIFNSDLLTERTLRFVWHLLTIAWLALAAILFALDMSSPSTAIARIIAMASFVSSVIALTVTRGRHFSWIVLLAISLLIWLGN